MATAIVMLPETLAGLHFATAFGLTLRSLSNQTWSRCVLPPSDATPGFANFVLLLNLTFPALYFFFGTLLGLKLAPIEVTFPLLAVPATATARMIAYRLLIRIYQSPP